jgi:hypothetical protein
MINHYSIVNCLYFIILILVSPVIVADENSESNDDDSDKQCLIGVSQIQSVADLDGDGSVGQSDKVILKKAIKKRLYYAFYDLNADGKLNRDDLERLKKQIGMNSTVFDQEVAALFHRSKQFQLVDSGEELNAMAYNIGTGSLAGHGEHWNNLDGDLSIAGYKLADFYKVEGINVPQDRGSVAALFWGQGATPVFANGADDYPTPGGAWENERVVAFAGGPPTFTSSPDELWHTHAGLCITTELRSTGIEIVLNQHTSYTECQAIPSLTTSSITGQNTWINIWMVHMWIYDLNPNGFFANTHPCIDPDAPSEHTINGGREVPPFFAHHGG